MRKTRPERLGWLKRDHDVVARVEQALLDDPLACEVFGCSAEAIIDQPMFQPLRIDRATWLAWLAFKRALALNR